MSSNTFSPGELFAAQIQSDESDVHKIGPTKFGYCYFKDKLMSLPRKIKLNVITELSFAIKMDTVYYNRDIQHYY